MDFDFKRCFVIAEIGVNHNGSLDMARELIDVAAGAGADAVKFQTFFADELVTPDARKAGYQVANTGDAGNQHQMLKALELTAEQFAALREYCGKTGVEFLSTPFSEGAADLLLAIGVGGFKVSSGDLTHLPLLRHIARKGKPVILSSGMATLGEIEDAVGAITAEGNERIAILHCVSNYPADPEDCNLAAMETIARAFGLPVGWSDHTTGAAISIAAVARGARIIEKHITLDCDLPGPDHRASMPPEEFRRFVAGIREVEAAIGDGIKRPTRSERKTAEVARRSLVAARALKAGDVLRADDIVIMRPGNGIAPKHAPMLVGKVLLRDLPKYAVFEPEHFHGT